MRKCKKNNSTATSSGMERYQLINIVYILILLIDTYNICELFWESDLLKMRILYISS